MAGLESTTHDPVAVAGIHCREIADMCACDPCDQALLWVWLDAIARLVAIFDAVEIEPVPGAPPH